MEPAIYRFQLGFGPTDRPKLDVFTMGVGMVFGAVERPVKEKEVGVLVTVRLGNTN